MEYRYKPYNKWRINARKRVGLFLQALRFSVGLKRCDSRCITKEDRKKYSRIERGVMKGILAGFIPPGTTINLP